MHQVLVYKQFISHTKVKYIRETPPSTVSLAGSYVLLETTVNTIPLKQNEEEIPIVRETPQSFSKDIQKFKQDGDNR